MVGYLREADISKIEAHSMRERGGIWRLTLLEEIEPCLKVALCGEDKCV